MTPRERVIASLNHQEPDRVPLDLGSLSSTIETGPYEKLKRHLKLETPTVTFLREHVDPDEYVLDLFSIDTRYVRIGKPHGWSLKMGPNNSYVDEWGTTFRKPSTSHYFDPVPPYPLADASVKDIESYPWPDPNDPGRTEGLARKAKELRDKTEYAIVADVPLLGPLEFSWLLLRGPEFLEDLIANKTFAIALLEKITDLHIQIFDKFLSAVGQYIDVVCVCEDLGTQNDLLISDRMYRDILKPFHKRLWGHVKSKTDAKLFLHSCGSIIKLLPDLIDLGVEIINPVQVSAKGMDTAFLKKEFGKDLTFWGGVDTQWVMPKGSLSDVSKEVKRRIKDLAPGGGFVLTAVHNIQDDVPPENIIEMYREAKENGRYPINIK